jgi:hypothetical protein
MTTVRQAVHHIDGKTKVRIISALAIHDKKILDMTVEQFISSADKGKLEKLDNFGAKSMADLFKAVHEARNIAVPTKCPVYTAEASTIEDVVIDMSLGARILRWLARW